jgi:dihydrofolate reductase
MREHLTSIVAIDRQGAIGCQNRLPWSIKTDMSFFRTTTLGNNVIMGRKTYESIGACLKGRTNLVLSHNAVLFASTERCRVVNSIDETLAAALNCESGASFVVGGGATYSEFAPFVDQYLITLVDHEVTNADAFLAMDIREEYGAWACEEIGTYPAKPGHDEFPFRILRFSAPDALERAESRKALANRHLAKVPNQVSRGTARRRQGPSRQEAFSF